MKVPSTNSPSGNVPEAGARIAVLADLGQDVYHAGDEAMGHAAADELRSRGHRVLMLSRNPAQTEQLFESPAAATLPFPWPPAEREAYLQRIQAHLSGTSELPAGDPARILISELSGCDGVLIAGGGNLNSRYGWLLYERAAVVAVARALGKPVVVSGQTLGPQLTAADTMVLAELLASAALSSMREPTSTQLARSLGIAPVAGLDDASFLPAEYRPAGLPADLPENGYVAVTVSPYSGPEDYSALIGAQLDALYGQTGLPTVFIPHMGVGDEPGWDVEAHARIAGSMHTPSRQLPVLPARQVAALTAGAELVFTSRYHPAVFALSAGVPVVALSVDTYSGVRLAGAMGNWGLADFVLPLPALDGGLLGPALAEAWQRRTEIAGHLSGIRPSRAAWSRLWWDAAAAVFPAQAPGTAAAIGTGSAQVLPPSPETGSSAADLPPAPRFRAAGPWLAASEKAATGFYAQSGMDAQAGVEEDRLMSYLEQRSRELEVLQAEHQRLLTSRTVNGALALHRAGAKLLRR